jgi:NADH:ubiquinone oxidoreductase subunit 3 (subunit A)
VNETGALTPLLGMALFAAFACGIYWLGGVLAARGRESPGKYLPYACGEDLPVTEMRLSYQRFFRLALMFIVAHIAILVVATLSIVIDNVVAVLYLVAVVMCVDILQRD